MNRYEEALVCAKWAVTNAPGNGDCHYILGAVYGGLYEYEKAVRESKIALELMPMHPGATWNLALYLFGVGKYTEGFKHYEIGKLSGLRALRSLMPAPTSWEQLRGKNVHVWCEQGNGDVFMFARYLRALKEIANSVVFEVYDCMTPIFFNHKYADIVYQRPDNFYMPYPDCDYSLSLVDLGSLHISKSGNKVMMTRREDLSIEDSLLEQVEPYFQNLNPDGKFKIGVCWKGESTHSNDCNRSSTFEEFVKPLLGIKNSMVFGLQYDDSTPNQDNFHNLGGELANWAITASYLLQMDAVVTVDTAIANLAGVLGVQTIVVCPYSNEWRWGYRPDKLFWTCDWYLSTLAVCRQSTRKDWNSIIPEVRTSLERRINLKWHKTTPDGPPSQT